MRHISTIILFVIALQSIYCVTGKRLKADPFAIKQGRVVGGVIAEEGLAPYMVSLQNTLYHFCGGAIIDNEWIITAGHCVANKNVNQISVLTGTQDLEDSSGVKYYADRIYVHCNYDNPSMHNDIALLHLNDSIVLNAKTQIIPLAKKPLNDGDDVLLTGWGTDEPWGESPDHLMKVDLKYVSHERCKEAHNFNNDVDVGHICTYTKSGEGSCHGDSGGPLVSNGYLVGIVNWGRPCAVGYPDVHASPFYYSDWIRNVMEGNSECENLHAFIKDRN